MATDVHIGRRLPCTLAQLERLRAVMFAVFNRSEHDANVLRGYLLADYGVELAVLLAGAHGLQNRLFYWCRRAPRRKIGYRAGRPPRRRRKASKARRRGRAVDIPGICR